MDHPGFLQRVQVVGRADAFDGEDFLAVLELADRHHTGLDRLVVDQYRAGATLAGIATDLAAGEQQLLAQHISQLFVGIDDERPIDTVYIDDDSFHGVLLIRLQRNVAKN